MISLKEARALALAELRRLLGEKIVIRDEFTIAEDFGWVFFYDSEGYVVHGNSKAQMIGNAPLIVNRDTGRISRTGTSLPIHEYIQAYKDLGPARFDSDDLLMYIRRKFPPDLDF